MRELLLNSRITAQTFSLGTLLLPTYCVVLSPKYILYQVFSKQALLMDTLVEHFAGEYRKRLGQETPSDHANYADYHSGRCAHLKSILSHYTPHIIISSDRRLHCTYSN